MNAQRVNLFSRTLNNISAISGDHRRCKRIGFFYEVIEQGVKMLLILFSEATITNLMEILSLAEGKIESLERENVEMISKIQLLQHENTFLRKKAITVNQDNGNNTVSTKSLNRDLFSTVAIFLMGVT